MATLPAVGEATVQQGYDRKEVIYGRKFGTALTLDVFAPKKDGNGAGVVFVVSGGWYSDHNNVSAFPAFLPSSSRCWTKVSRSLPWSTAAIRNFRCPKSSTICTVVLRFIRFNAKDYGIDQKAHGHHRPSAGGHLSLMQGCAGKEGNPKAADPVDRESSRVQAVVAFYPPTDFLNWGEKGKVMLGELTVVPVKGVFDFYQLESQNACI